MGFVRPAGPSLMLQEPTSMASLSPTGLAERRPLRAAGG